MVNEIEAPGCPLDCVISNPATLPCKDFNALVVGVDVISAGFIEDINDKVNTKHKVSIKIENGNINAILNKIFQGTNMTYQVDGDHILISTTHKSIGLDETRIDYYDKRKNSR